MKTIKKLIIPILSISTISLPLESISSCACSQEQDNYNYTNDILDEFRGNGTDIAGLTSCPRPSGYHDKIVPYLVSRAKALVGLQDNQILTDEAGNICFDVPATKGYEDKDMVILQGHSDMVVAGLDEQLAKTSPIDVVIEDNLLHSKDYKTSIGADDGAGVSIALAILKNRDKFKHGPIRCIFTADEDIGMVGASKMDHKWLFVNNQPVKWLINIDAEELGNVYRSCQGNVRLDFDKTVNGETNFTYQYGCILTLDGLLGGHSADAITQAHANADRLGYEFLQRMNEIAHNAFQLIHHDHGKKVDGKLIDIQYSKNQIIANCRIMFNSKLPPDALSNYFKLALEQYKTLPQYKGDDWDSIIAKSSITEATPSVTHISAEESSDIIEFLGGPLDDKDATELTRPYFGYFNWLDDTHIVPDCSANIGPVDIGQLESGTNFRILIGSSCRSSIGTQTTDPLHSINWFKQQYKTMAGKHDYSVIDGPIYYPWPKSDNNKLVELTMKEFEKLDLDSIAWDSPAGVEPAWWNQYTDGKMTCTVVGPTIDAAHSERETLHIDTLNPVTKVIIGVLKELTK